MESTLPSTLNNSESEVYINQQEWEVEKIIRDRQILKQNRINNRVEPVKEYLVQWVGYKYPTWEPVENLENCQEILNDYLSRKKHKIMEDVNSQNQNEQNKDELNNSYRIFNLTDDVDFTEFKNYDNTNNKMNSEIEEYINDDESMKESEILNISSIINELKEKDNLNVNSNNNNNKIGDIFDAKLSKNIYELNYDSINNSNVENENNKEKTDKIFQNSMILSRGKFNINNNQDYLDKSEGEISLNEIANCLPSNAEPSNSEEKKINDVENYINGTERQNMIEEYELLNQKRERKEQKNKSEIRILEIISLQVPRKRKGKYLLTIKYKNLNDNKVYIKDIKSRSKDIPKDCLIKYYEHIFFERNRGQKISKRVAFI